MQAQLACNSIKTLVEVDDLSDKLDRMFSILKKGSGGGYCDVPGLPDLIVGLDEPLKELKRMVLKTDASVVVLSAPGGCGKTTLAKMMCKDKEIQGIYSSLSYSYLLLLFSFDCNYIGVL